MSLPLRFGVLAPQVVPYAVQAERWKELDDYGFDSLWFADHFVNPARPAGRWFEAYTLMAAAAVQTERIRLGALVTSISFRHPALLAKEALTIDHISGGRFELGIGAAGAVNDIAMMGLPVWEPIERARRFRDFARTLDALLRGDATDGGGTSYAGAYYEVTEAVMDPGPVQLPRPPMTLAAARPVNMKFTARHAESWNQIPSDTIDGGRPLTTEECVEQARSRNAQMDDFCAELSRDPATLRRSILAGGGVTPDNVWGSVESFRDFTGRYMEAGVNEFIFYYPSRVEQADGHYERIAREVIPELKRNVGGS
ncbi:MAG: LLM class flavin-dependent oxidoreductase [Chloroflexi bacterium]|nr:LLM class flavin-dependent oxidoreductase [Chloroflexota bacterium]